MMHDNTIKNIKDIEAILRTIKNKQEKSLKEIEVIQKDEMYAPAYKESKIFDIKSKMEAFSAEYSDKLFDLADAILKEETELLNDVIDINDNSLINAVNLINIMGENLPSEQQKKIAKMFSNNYPAQKCIAELYKKFNYHYVVELTDFNKFCAELNMKIGAFISEKEKTARSYRGIEKVLNDMLDVIHADYQIDLGVKDLALNEYAQIGAGIKKL